jgi:hypothetical protein
MARPEVRPTSTSIVPHPTTRVPVSVAHPLLVTHGVQSAQPQASASRISPSEASRVRSADAPMQERSVANPPSNRRAAEVPAMRPVTPQRPMANAPQFHPAPLQRQEQHVRPSEWSRRETQRPESHSEMHSEPRSAPERRQEMQPHPAEPHHEQARQRPR